MSLQTKVQINKAFSEQEKRIVLRFFTDKEPYNKDKELSRRSRVNECVPVQQHRHRDSKWVLVLFILQITFKPNFLKVYSLKF